MFLILCYNIPLLVLATNKLGNVLFHTANLFSILESFYNNLTLAVITSQTALVYTEAAVLGVHCTLAVLEARQSEARYLMTASSV